MFRSRLPSLALPFALLACGGDGGGGAAGGDAAGSGDGASRSDADGANDAAGGDGAPDGAWETGDAEAGDASTDTDGLADDLPGDADAGLPDVSPVDARPTDVSPVDSHNWDIWPIDGATDGTGPAPTCEEIVPGDWDGAAGLPFDPDAVAESSVSFPTGVMSGAARPESIYLWTFIADGAPKALRVWRASETPGEVLLVHEAEVEPGPDGYTHVTVDDLAPCTWYSYAFFGDGEGPGFGARSRIGSFRTAFAPGVREPLVVGATSCTHHDTQPFEAIREIARQPIDIFIHLGDFSYNDAAETRAEYRQLWRQSLTYSPGYPDLLPTTSMLAVWDDHEYDNDWDGETFDPTRRATALAAFFETLAVQPADDAGRLWQSYQWGDTVEFIMLDCRGERLPSTRELMTAEYIGEEQMAWLKDRLLHSTAHFKLVMNSVPITNMPSLWDFAPWDRWEGYAAQRRELLDYIVENGIRNVWFVSGDFHVGFVGHVEPDGGAFRIREIAAGPGANGPNPLFLTLGAPQFEFNTGGEKENMTTLTFDPGADAVRVMFGHGDGEITYDEWLTEEE